MTYAGASQRVDAEKIDAAIGGSGKPGSAVAVALGAVLLAASTLGLLLIGGSLAGWCAFVGPRSRAARSIVNRPVAARRIGSAQASDDVARLSHDFGVVAPRSVLSWDYPIENPSGRPWTIDRVEVSCRCTVASVSSPVIAPGQQELVTLALDCGSDAVDIAKSATVRFKEADAPPVRLRIRASVRASMTPSTREVAFGALTAGNPAEYDLLLLNYSAAEWSAVRIESCPEWASVVVLPYRTAGQGRSVRTDSPSAPSPLEVWHAAVTLSAQLGEGYVQAPVRLRADTGDSCEFFIAARVEAAVRLVPDKLVFVAPRTKSPCIRTSRVIVQAQSDVLRVDARPDAGSLTVELRRINDRVWELTAKLAAAPGANDNGTITLAFPGTALPDAALAYSIFMQ